MAYDALFHYGEDVETIPYTPVADVVTGQVIVLGQLVGIATRPIKANVLGALNIARGVYIVTAAGAYAIGTSVYWDAAAHRVTTTTTGNKAFGILTQASSGAGVTVDCFHMPSLV